MTTPTPIAGLSLIVHLFIIGMSFILKLFQRKIVVPTIRKANALPGRMKVVLLRVASVSIMSFIIVGVVYTTSVAVRTGFREGQRESHIEYVREKYGYIKGLFSKESNIGKADARTDARLTSK